MKSLFFLLSLLPILLLSDSALAQDAVLVSEVSHDTVGLDDVFSVTFSLVGGEARQPEVTWGELQLVGGPSTSTQIQMINGSTTRKQTWTYQVKATKKGSLLVPAAKVKIGKVSVESNEILIYVVPGKKIIHKQQQALIDPFGFPGFSFPDPFDAFPSFPTPSQPRAAPQPQKPARKTYKL
jgi:BatD DUF11 like domain